MLVVSLVVLVVISMLGLAAMQGVGMEFKIAKNTQSREQIFQASEAVLRRVESNLQAFPYSAGQLDSAACASGSSDCFDDSCAGGLCFFGVNNTATQQACSSDPAVPGGVPVWSKDHSLDVWQVAGRHQSLNHGEVAVDYIIEFRCFIDSYTGTVATDSGDAFFRITVLGADADERIKVMLQSTYSVPLG